ncbi:MAG: cobyrinate a,c-diamide synthase [Kaiparowitsia implicata GSE-PSE-MK54-09C]|jgi:cobyrinic acid a,c-diamide synthase|nr:cobyrinate a,c-diamide synthase [Kaiparowitsia implicata GSE-PSE-MK54-09C]
MGIVIAGERSGAGKTTVTLALLAALRQHRAQVQSFKVGPDYIDPMFHTRVTGRACRNLDPVLTSERYVQQCFARHNQDADYTLVEGVMGLFDGASRVDDVGSTAHVARLLDLPVVLILNCSSLSRSVAAIAHGYRTLDPRLRFAGLVLNQVGSDRHLDLLQSALEPLGLPILGLLRREGAIAIPDRHLGLIPTGELPHLEPLIDRLAQLGNTCFDWDALLPLLTPTAADRQIRNTTLMGSGMNGMRSHTTHDSPSRLPAARIAIAQDAAFNFYYADNLDLLHELGAELLPWSPLRDGALPQGTQGLYFGGGFPEVFAAELAENHSARQVVRTAVRAGMPTYAECGGLMYLCESIVDFEQQRHPMVGALPTTATMGKRLTLGYRQAIAYLDSPLVKTGDRLWGHEFHRSTLDAVPDAPLFTLQSYDGQPLGAEGWQQQQVHGSYVHVHWGDRPDLPQRFLNHCAHYQPVSISVNVSLG